MAALPQKHFDSVRKEEIRQGQKPFGLRIQGPTFTKEQMKSFLRSEIAAPKALICIVEMTNAYDIGFEIEGERNALSKSDGKRLLGYRRPLRVAAKPFTLGVEEIFNYVQENLAGEECNCIWSKALRLDNHPEDSAAA